MPIKYHTVEQLNSIKPLNSILTAISFGIDGGGYRAVHCICQCGNKITCRVSGFVDIRMRSCGCMRKKNFNNKTHGYSGGKKCHPIYKVWEGMKARCNYKNHESYPRYGGRGIKVCKAWATDFMSFYNWAISKWAKGLMLDRRNNDKNYTPSNCRFVTPKVNANNRMNTIYWTYNNKTLTISQWSDLLDIKASLLRGRLYRGWSIDKILSTPLN